MIVQWCCKGVANISKHEAHNILTGGAGLLCRLWQKDDPLRISEATTRLTEHHLDLHVNHYDDQEAATGLPVRDVTPFLSLSAGCVSRDMLLKTNVLHRARRTALAFGTEQGRTSGWLFTCYVLVSVNRAVGVPAVSEEIRELHHNRRYSPYYTEGEITAKINVPSTQILCAERWEPQPPRGTVRTGIYVNRGFSHPSALLDERRML
jgi:hypothetical protein